jgi:sialic acid synthase SpsE
LGNGKIKITPKKLFVVFEAYLINKSFPLSSADKGIDCRLALEPQELKRLCEEKKWLGLP